MSNYAATQLSRRLAAVVMTYTTRPLVWWAVGIGMVTSLFTGNWLWFAFVPIASGMILNFQAKSHFVTPAARLVPNYRASHLSVLTVLAIACCVLGPLVGTGVNLSALGLVALAACLGVLTLWAYQLPPLFLLLLPFVFSLMRPEVRGFWLDPSIDVTPFRLAFFVAGWSGFAFWLRQLATMHEERDDYVIPPLAGTLLRPSRNERAEQRKFAARQLNRRWQGALLLDPRIDRALARRPPLAPAELVRLGLGPYSALRAGVSLSVLFGGMWIVMAIGWMTVPQESIAVQLLLVGSVAPAFLVFVQIDEKRSRLEGDLLRPMKRDAFYTSLLGGYLRNLAVVVGAFIFTVVMIAACYLPKLVSISTAIAFAAHIATSNYLFAAVNLHLASRIGALPRMAILFVPILGMFALNVWMWRLLDDYGVGPILACSVVYATLAALTLRAAHLRWLNVEVG